MTNENIEVMTDEEVENLKEVARITYQKLREMYRPSEVMAISNMMQINFFTEAAPNGAPAIDKVRTILAEGDACILSDLKQMGWTE